MTIKRTALIAGAIVASTSLSTFAQNSQQSMPPRVVGSVQVDSITRAPVRVIRSVTLDAIQSDVFEFVTDHGNWPNFIAPIQSVKVNGSGQDGSSRSFTFADGAVVSERIVAFNEPGGTAPATFAYSIAPNNPFGIQNHLAVIALAPADGGGTVLHYHQYLNHPNLEAVLPVVAGGTDQIVGHILAKFGGALRGATTPGSTVRIQQQRIVEASADRTWTVLGEQWGDVDEWSSMIAHSNASGWNEHDPSGAVRSCDVPGTPGFRETMIAYNEDELMLSYQVLEGMPPFVTRALNTWTIRELGDERVLMTSVIELNIAEGTPDPASGMVTGQFTQILDLTIDELTYFIETNRPHPRTVSASAERP